MLKGNRRIGAKVDCLVVVSQIQENDKTEDNSNKRKRKQPEKSEPGKELKEDLQYEINNLKLRIDGI